MKHLRKQIAKRTLSAVLLLGILFSIVLAVPVHAAQADIEFSVDASKPTYEHTGVQIAPGKTLTVNVGSASYYFLTIPNENVSVTFKDVEYPAQNGQVQVYLQKSALSVLFQITNHSSVTQNLTLYFSRPEGHKDLPIVLKKMEDFEVNQQAKYANNLDIGTFYSWTAPSDGKLDLQITKIDSALSGMKPSIKINEYYLSEDGAISMDVTKNQKLEICVAALLNGAAFDAVISVAADFSGEQPDLPPEPVDPPAKPTNPPEEPTDPPTQPTDPPVTEPSEPEHECYVDHFTDVNTSKWYHEALDYMVSNGYMNGMSDTTMEPNGSLTRAQWAKLLYEIEGKPSVAGLSHPFTDVPAGKWYTDPVIWAYNAGIVKGVSATTFGPSSQITREQMATMLYRYAGSPSVSGNLMSFNDASKVGNFAWDAMVWATQNEIVNGVGGGRLDPKGNATRAQAAKILYEYDK